VDQQDAYEFLQHALKKIKENQRRTGGHDVTHSFVFDVEQRVQCSRCKGCRYGSEKGAEVLSLGIPTELAQPPLAPSAKGETAAERMTRHYKSSVPFSALLERFVAPEDVENSYCPKCKAATLAIKQQSMATFPEVVVAHVSRFTFENWVPQKLSVQISGLSNGEGAAPPVIDLGVLQSRERDASELVVDDSSSGGASAKSEGEHADPAIVAALEGMGFPRVQCERAAFESKNVGTEEAMNYLFAHMEDGTLDVKLFRSVIILIFMYFILQVPLKKAVAPKAASFAPELIEQLCAMGFGPGQAKKALRECGGNVERGVDWLFSHPEVQEDDEAVAVAPSNAHQTEPRGPKLYQLWGFILHKGNQIQSGHYVAYIYSDVHKHWIIYDDERVAISQKPPVEQAYLYIFRRVKQ
jgi:ubiquitin carboxyl-terminal hydrolase 5/13